jgi:hypothetical protein
MSKDIKGNESSLSDPRIHLIRVRNPWGDKNEWRGKDKRILIKASW